jgi:hypothetical protein
MAITTMKSNKGWHSWWFYIKNHDTAPLPLFTGRTIMVAPLVWSWWHVDKERKRLTLLLGTIVHLKGHGLYGTSVIRAYYSRWVALLMARVLQLYGMAPGVWLEGTVLAQDLLRDLEIQQRIREVLDEPDAVFLVEGQLAKRPDTDFIDLVSTCRPPLHVSLLS